MSLAAKFACIAATQLAGPIIVITKGIDLSAGPL
jgi:hypothetical protein